MKANRATANLPNGWQRKRKRLNRPKNSKKSDKAHKPCPIFSFVALRTTPLRRNRRENNRCSSLGRLVEIRGIEPLTS